MAIGASGYNGMRAVALLCMLTSVYCLTVGNLPRIGYPTLAVGLLLTMGALWYRYDLSDTPPKATPRDLDDILAPPYWPGCMAR